MRLIPIPRATIKSKSPRNDPRRIIESVKTGINIAKSIVRDVKAGAKRDVFSNLSSLSTVLRVFSSILRKLSKVASSVVFFFIMRYQNTFYQGLIWFVICQGLFKLIRSGENYPNSEKRSSKRKRGAQIPSHKSFSSFNHFRPLLVNLSSFFSISFLFLNSLIREFNLSLLIP